MIQIIEFAILVIIISASGVMSPGPLFAANITYGLREGVKSGIKIAIGHSIVELPLVILLGIGAFSLEIFPEFRTIISIFGALTLFVICSHSNQDNNEEGEIYFNKTKTRTDSYRYFT